MFKTAETTLRENLCLKKVIIMEHFPRYDTKDVDPQQIKTNLAKYANNVLAQIWLNSPYRNKIMIGQHNVEVGEFGIKHDEAFKNDKRYDGVHFDGKSGPSIYNKSLICMIRKALFNESLKSSQEQIKPSDNHLQNPGKAHLKSNQKPYTQPSQAYQNIPIHPSYHQFCPQAQYQRKQQSLSAEKYHPSIQDRNRFSVFNSNVGNY